MQVSVVIPVCDAERYVRQAVQSALAQPETGEVLLVEDGSGDDSLRACAQLAGESPRVRLLRHADGKNHGPGASRNLGIKSARLEYLAFLDADDYFLPGRFAVARTLLENDPALEGVYEAVGFEFDDEESRQRWTQEHGPAVLTTMNERVAPEELFEKQSPLGFSGHCTTGGWVLRKSVLARTGLFDEGLRLHQDTVMFVRLAAVGRMMPGRLDEPVAIRRVHGANRSSSLRPTSAVYRDRIRMWVSLWRWGKANLPRGRQDLLLSRFLRYVGEPSGRPGSPIGSRIRSRIRLSLLGLANPGLLLEPRFWAAHLKLPLPRRLK